MVPAYRTTNWKPCSHPSTVENARAAGLGLTVARQGARAAGGDVTLSNRSGGLTARLHLPLQT